MWPDARSVSPKIRQFGKFGNFVKKPADVAFAIGALSGLHCLMSIALDSGLADTFARIALGHLTREYPNKLDHVLNDVGDVQAPHQLHPIFYGSFDWHSCVHGYWLLVRVAKRFPELPVVDEIRLTMDRHFTESAVAGEIAYLLEPSRQTFERPYGWAWLLKLAAELADWDHPDGRRWSAVLAPLADVFAEWFLEFLPKATYPVRAGTHANSAFSLALALDYARAVPDGPLDGLIREKAQAWFGGDADCPAWEPGGEDFLSPALMEAELMRRVLPADEFVAWLDRFLPQLVERRPATLFSPAQVSDRTDGKIAHLDGLNFSRAWCWRSIVRALPAGDPRGPLAEAAAEAHVKTTIREISSDYMGEHWLATFAMLALEA